MVSLIDKNLELSLSHTHIVKEVCRPLFENTIVNYFNFARKYNDGSNISLSTHEEWSRCYYKNGLYNVMDEDTDVATFRKKEEKEGYRNFFRLEFQQCIAGQTSMRFGVGTDLAMVLLSSEYCDYYFFGADVSATPEDRINLYIKNPHIFTHFIFYFHEKCESIINTMARQENRILRVSRELQKPEQGLITNGASLDNSFSELLNKMPISKYKFVIKNKEIFLTTREAQCLSLWMRSKTTKFIANYLDLSCRTVETHLEKIKNKLGCDTKGQIIDLVSAFSSGYQEEISSNMLAVERVLWKGNKQPVT